jgi:hypothetical protein
MSPDVQRIAEQLGGARRHSTGWVCRCPAHDDDKASLTLREVDGKVLWHCFAGCEQTAVGDALRGRGLLNGFDSRPAARMRSSPRSSFHLAGLGEPSAVWTYRSPEGTELLKVARYEADDGKSIRPWKSRAGGGWELGALPEPRPLYALDLLAQHPDRPVVVVEGEKCADACAELISSQFVCMTWAGGAAAPSKSDWSVLRGRHVTIWPDADDPGRKAAKVIVTMLSGIASSVRVVDPGDRPKGWDVADALAEGWTAADVLELLAGAAEPQATHVPPDHDDAPEGRESGAAEGSIVDGADFAAGYTLPDWLVDGVIQRGYLYGLTARGNHGKTGAAIWLAMCVALGRPFGPHRCQRGRVLVLAGENPEDVRGRVLAAVQVLGLTLAAIRGRLAFHTRRAALATAWPNLRREVEALGAFDLVIVDSSAAFFSYQDEDANVPAGDHARDLRRLTELPGRPATLVLCHPTKHADADNLLPRGGSAFYNELDGNLTLWADGSGAATLSHNKVRGPTFEPLVLAVEAVEIAAYSYADGRHPTAGLLRPVSSEAVDALEQAADDDDDAVLRELYRHPKASLRGIAEGLGFKGHARVQRALKRLKEDKLVRSYRRRWQITAAGEKEVTGGVG